MKNDQKYKIFQKVCLLFLCFMMAFPSYSQDDGDNNTDFYQKVEGAYIFGVQLYNNNIIYNPGWALHFTHGAQIHEDIGIGAGVGYVSLQDEYFMPLFIDITGHKKDNRNTPFISFQVGYAFGWNHATDQKLDYKFTGGPYFKAGLGRRIEINDQYSLLFQTSYYHQFAKMEYKRPGENSFSEILNYDMILLSLGIIVH